jgi:hypothetical protein
MKAFSSAKKKCYITDLQNLENTVFAAHLQQNRQKRAYTRTSKQPALPESEFL